MIEDGKWIFPENFKSLYPVVMAEVEEVLLSDHCSDEIIWEGATDGIIIVKTAYDIYRDKLVSLRWKKKLWNQFIPPKLSVLAWKITSNRLLTGDVLCKKGIIPASVCIGCISGAMEDATYLLLQCTTSSNMWA